MNLKNDRRESNVQLTRYGEGLILSPNTTWPRFSTGESDSSTVQKSNLKHESQYQLYFLHYSDKIQQLGLLCSSWTFYTGSTKFMHANSIFLLVIFIRHNSFNWVESVYIYWYFRLKKKRKVYYRTQCTHTYFNCKYWQ